MAYDPKLAFQSANRLIKYETPSPVMDYYDPVKGLALQPLKISEIPQSNPNASLDEFANLLLRRGIPSGGTSGGLNPYSANLLGTYSNLNKSSPSVSDQ